MKKYLIIILSIFVAACANQTQTVEGENELLLIAHRGANNLAPEHTIPAYEKAIELNADYIEIDLRMSKDGHLIALHDETLDRTTGISGEPTDYTLDELKQFDAGSWYSEDFKDEKIPTLEEIFDTFKEDTRYYIETRTVNDEIVMEEKLIELIKEKNLSDRVIIQSFSEESLKKIDQLNEDIPLVQLVYNENIDEVNGEEIKSYATGIGPFGLHINEDFVKRMQKEGLDVHVWFFNESEKELIQEVLSMGVDGVFTDFLNNTEEVMNQIDEKQDI